MKYITKRSKRCGREISKCRKHHWLTTINYRAQLWCIAIAFDIIHRSKFGTLKARRQSAKSKTHTKSGINLLPTIVFGHGRLFTHQHAPSKANEEYKKKKQQTKILPKDQLNGIKWFNVVVFVVFLWIRWPCSALSRFRCVFFSFSFYSVSIAICFFLLLYHTHTHNTHRARTDTKNERKLYKLWEWTTSVCSCPVPDTNILYIIFQFILSIPAAISIS